MKDIEEDKKEQQEEVQNPPAPAPSVTEMEQAHAEELSGLQQTNQQRYNDVSDIIAEAETKLGAMKQNDEVAQKRSNAFRYIAGLGDTLSGIANLVGTAHGAQNQQQVYNGGRVAERAEQSRKERKLEMDNMNTRIDEMRARQRELKTAGSLAEAEMKARQARELATEKNRVAAIEREEAWKKKQQDWKEEEAARAQENWQKTFDAQQEQFKAEQTRLKEQSDAKIAADKEIASQKAALELMKQQEKMANDPKHQAQVLSSNIVGVRDELAQKMGYEDYNEYLRYKNVEGWGEDIDGQRNKDSKRIRDKRASENPEVEEFLKMLQHPGDLTEEEIRMLMGASKTFSDAVGASKVVEDTEGTAPKKQSKTDENEKETVDY